MAGTLQTTPWSLAPFWTLGSFTPSPLSPGIVPNVPFGGIGAGIAGPPAAPLAYLVQQLQQVQQAEYIQQQQLQQLLQVLQIVPQQIQQLAQVVHVLPQQIAQIVQQVIGQSPIAFQSGFAGLGAASPYGLSTAQPLQSAFGAPFASMAPGTSTQFPAGQPGYVM